MNEKIDRIKAKSCQKKQRKTFYGLERLFKDDDQKLERNLMNNDHKLENAQYKKP